MFGANLKARILAYEVLFSSIGFDFEKSAEKPDSLKAFLDAKLGAVKTEATTAAGGELLKFLGLAAVEGKSAADVVKGALTAKDASVAIYVDGLAAAGVKPTAQKDKALEAADIKTAVEARASQKGAAIAAAAGHEPITAPKGSEASASPADLQARYSELLASGKHTEASRFFDQNCAAMYPGSGNN